MDKNYTELCNGLSGNLKKLLKGIPDVMQGFSTMAQAATRDGALDKKTKEVEETLGMAIYMGGGPSLMYAADAIAAFEEFQGKAAVAA